MGSLVLSVHSTSRYNKMKTLLSIIFFTFTVNWTEGAPFSKLSNHDIKLSGDICKNLELQERGHHLVRDPNDSKKFFSCQYSRSGWLAYSMSCPDGTHFDGVYCVAGDSRSGKDFLIKENSAPSTPKYYTTTTSTSSTTEVQTEELTTTTTTSTTSTEKQSTITSTTPNTPTTTTTNPPTTTTATTTPFTTASTTTTPPTTTSTTTTTTTTTSSPSTTTTTTIKSSPTTTSTTTTT